MNKNELRVIRRLLPIGSWCRTAYQCRRVAPLLSLEETSSAPFDWTITPFRALSRILRNDFEPGLLLNPLDSYVNRVGSVTCGYSGIAFHHDLPVSLVCDHGSKLNSPSVPASIFRGAECKQSRERFMHTFANLSRLSKLNGNLFVRWMNTGPGPGVDWQFPEVFDGEAPSKIHELLTAFSGHDNFFLVSITSDVIEGVTSCIESPCQIVSSSGNVLELKIFERKGRNGDQSNDFRGDDLSWEAAFECAIAHFVGQVKG
jgi:hypothetical protein